MTESDTSSIESPLRIAVVGAGPAGLMFLLALLRRPRSRRRVEIVVFEREPAHAERDRADPDRSYTIDITGHGRKAIEAIGPDLVARFDHELIPFRGVEAHPMRTRLPYEPGAWTGSRGDICAALMHALEEALPTANDFEVTFRWGATVVDVDPVAGTVRCEGDAGDANAPFDLVIGADGGGSVLRRALTDQGRIETRRNSIPNFSRILHLDAGSPTEHLDPAHLHLFSVRPWAVGGAILSPEATAAGGPVDAASAEKSFFVQMGYWNEAPLGDVDAVRAALGSIRVRLRDGTHAPLTRFTSDAEIAAYAMRPVHHTGKTALASRLFAGRCVLLGDAATAFPPVGQGVNAALEAAIVLGEELGAVFEGRSLEAALELYDARWRPEAFACAEIANTVRYGSRLGLARDFALGLLGQLIRVEFLGPQLAKEGALSYSIARDAMVHRSRLAIGGALGIGLVLLLAL